MDWQQFDAAVQAAMQTFGMVGAAVAIVNGAGTLHAKTFGVRDLDSGAPVTPNTLFRIGSATKSMTALLVATLVDDGRLTWDQPVIDAWPAFRAPTDALTQTLRVRDLLGMDSGLGEPASTDLHFGDVTALGLLQSFTHLPVLGPPHSLWFYNNTVLATAGYLPLLAQGTAADDLQAAYASLMQTRIFGPAAMTSTRLGDDPRPFSDDYATGYGRDFVLGTAADSWVPIGSFAPAGSGLSSLTDMAGYISMQLSEGLSLGGTRVVSAGNLAECWLPHIDVRVLAALDPDTTSAGYGMGWYAQTYGVGRRLVWHNGFIEGFTTYIGFLPDDDLGLVVLTNQDTPDGLPFYTYVLNLFLSDIFGINTGANEAVASLYKGARQKLQDTAAQSGPVDPTAIGPYLGYYERGYYLAIDTSGALRLHQSTRAMRLLAASGGGYVLGNSSMWAKRSTSPRTARALPRWNFRMSSPSAG
jgi:CubicO group peptidase (beta-lactamase class C family)